MNAELFTIGRLSREAVCNVQTIRYYEQIGLLPAPLRSSGNQRLYDESWTRRLRFIRHARDLGFELDDVRILLDLADDPSKSCEAVDEVASTQLAEVEQRIRDLQALKRELQRMLKLCCLIPAFGSTPPGLPPPGTGLSTKSLPALWLACFMMVPFGFGLPGSEDALLAA